MSLGLYFNFSGELTVEQPLELRQGQALTQAQQSTAQEQEWAEELASQIEGQKSDGNDVMARQACSAQCLAASPDKQLQPSLRLPTPSPSQ